MACEEPCRIQLEFELFCCRRRSRHFRFGALEPWYTVRCPGHNALTRQRLHPTFERKRVLRVCFGVLQRRTPRSFGESGAIALVQMKRFDAAVESAFKRGLPHQLNDVSYNFLNVLGASPRLPKADEILGRG